jgi:hypothetical protein
MPCAKRPPTFAFTSVTVKTPRVVGSRTTRLQNEVSCTVPMP